MLDIKLVKEQHENCIRYANAMMTMIRIYQVQEDRGDSIKQCALEGRNALLKAKELEVLLDQANEITLILAA
jgi:hypothetical protein